MQTSMQAIGFRRYGSEEVLEPLALPIPPLGPGAVRVRVAAAGVNPADWRFRSGQFRWMIRLALPFVPGADIAGVVTEVGPQVRSVRPGDAVYAMLPTALGGGYAEYATVPEAAIARAPATLPLGDAAGIPLAGLTALQALRDRAGLQAGQHALIYGASGGVGSLAVQVARALGAQVTAATSARNLELVRSLGAHAVLDYAQPEALAAGGPYDVIFDAVNHLKFGRVRAALRPGGVFVSVNPILERLSPGWLARFRQGKRVRSLMVEPNGRDLETLRAWFDAGDLGLLVEQRYPLAEAAAAHRASATARVRGKLILVVDGQLAAQQAQPSVPLAAALIG